MGIQSRRAIQISQTPTTETPNLTGDVLGNSIDASTDPAGGYHWIGRLQELADKSFIQMQDSRY